MTICGTWVDSGMDYGMVKQQFRIEGGRPYTFSGWFWSDDASGNTFTADWISLWVTFYTNSPVAGNEVAGGYLFLEEPGSIWTYHTLSVEAPEEAEWGEVEIYVDGVGYDGALQSDDLFFGVR